MARYKCVYAIGKTIKEKTCEDIKSARRTAYRELMSGATDHVNVWTYGSSSYGSSSVARIVSSKVGHLIQKRGMIFWVPTNRHKDGSIDEDTAYTVNEKGDITFYKSRPHRIDNSPY